MDWKRLLEFLLGVVVAANATVSLNKSGSTEMPSLLNKSDGTIISVDSGPALLRAQCQAKCLQQFGKHRIAQYFSSEIMDKYECGFTCNACVQQCDVGVLGRERCVERCEVTYRENREEQDSCVSGCHHFHSLVETYIASSFRARFVVKIPENQHPLGPIVYVIDGKQRIHGKETGNDQNIRWHFIGSKLGEVGFTLDELQPGSFYKLRVMAVHPDGMSMEYVESKWVETLDPNALLKPPINLQVINQYFSGSEMHAVVEWKPDLQYPTCFYRLVWYHDRRPLSVSLGAVHSMKYLLKNLTYESLYNIRIRALSRLNLPRKETFPILTHFTTLSCLQWHNYNFTICGPGSVTNLSVSVGENSAFVSWMPPEKAEPLNKISGYRMWYRSLRHRGHCQTHISKDVTIPGDITNYDISDLGDGCVYVLKISAFGGKSNKMGPQSSALYFNLTREIHLTPLDFASPFNPLYFLILVFFVLTCVVTYVCVKLRHKEKALAKGRDVPLFEQFPSLISRSLGWNNLYPVTGLPSNPGSDVAQLNGWNSIRTASDATSVLSPTTHTTTAVNSGLDSLTRSPSIPSPSFSVPDIQTTTRSVVQGIEVGEGSLVGEGHFSFVYKVSSEDPSLSKSNPIALKVLKSRLTGAFFQGVFSPSRTASPTSMESFCREVDLMRRLKPHPHIVGYIGCSIDRCWLLLEFCEEGNLRAYLRRIRNKQERERVVEIEPQETINQLKALFMSYSRQIALGMEFLASQSVLHRDLAARNILVSGGGRIVKISDFGLAIPMGHTDSAPYPQLPIKWMAPESIFARQFSEKSDIWSYGVVLWELTSVGGEPYSGLGVSSPEGMLSLLSSAYRMPTPTLCVTQLRELMEDCWGELAAARPTFHIVRRRLERLMEGIGEYLTLEEVHSLSSVYYKNIVEIRRDS